MTVLKRKTNTKRLIENIEKLISFGNMHIHIDLIAGLTGEDLESFKNSFNIGYSLKAHMLQMGFLKLLYGAEMRENSEKYPCVFNEEPPYEVISTPCLSNTEIKMLKNCEDALDRLYNSGRFLFTLEFLIEKVGISPFDVFCDFGSAVNGSKMKLCDYAEKLYNFFCDKCDSEKLREKILCDLLCCSSSVQIPEVLKHKDPLYKKVKTKLDGNVNYAIIYSENNVFIVSQNSPRDLFNRKQGEFIKLENFIDK